MVLRRIAKEIKARKTDEAKDEDEKQLPTALNFLTSVGESREVLLNFLAEDDITEEHASAMRVYMNRKYGLSTTAQLACPISHRVFPPCPGPNEDESH
ncbi:hypothetical protein OS493_033186 [Desmophyllum pertusum]|uniref:Uncharacterized protein n=1 Tax=Desmophyllum pertusum TaxID=174260 RepID=A0A9W9Y829_9CNID|nr:hypothetical protein OS493_033186 [Desmophyllum pertusum]